MEIHDRDGGSPGRDDIPGKQRGPGRSGLLVDANVALRRQKTQRPRPVLPFGAQCFNTSQEYDCRQQA
jgi:hypothetical protein